MPFGVIKTSEALRLEERIDQVGGEERRQGDGVAWSDDKILQLKVEGAVT
jgi:hypothetical protein